MKNYKWFGLGDVNAFFGLTLDNVAVLLILVTTITSSVPWLEQKPGNRSFSPDFVISHMVPGTAIGVLLGDLVYTWMAFRLARKTGNQEVTAMPLGLDTPSTFGVAFLVLLPALTLGHKQFPGDPGVCRLGPPDGFVKGGQHQEKPGPAPGQQPPSLRIKG